MSNHSLVLKPTFVRAPLANGIGRYIGQLQRMTIKYCKSHGSSHGIRTYLENNLVDFAKSNPGVVVYVKPRRHRTPVIIVNGERHWVSVSNFSKEEIIKWIELLRTQSKDGSEMRIRKKFYTNFPSIQKPWTPFTFMNPIQNLVQIPDPNIVPENHKKSASEVLLELYEAEKLSEATKISN
ncbi:39S ribosomal protein L43, mitochondrial isoform X2 [Chelonus insularis]|uniref:39S ribosomal protein L43, mitochondrial isoform X2 n=1 Tax=Chelonus insularis TaxID=460826 RepID=UPI00158BA32C|nr:39S ribosomal protein L43, mitochondrial isoform X2 [Chelonus insularis]